MGKSALAMKSTFWGLKDNWWKQIYDGKYHSLGPDVFDLGLHRNFKGEGETEPGYYAGVKKASEYASKQLGKPLTKDVYVKIHALACDHFTQLDPRVINVDKENINKFRATNCESALNLVKEAYEQEDKIHYNIKKYSFKFIHSIRWKLQGEYSIITETGSRKELGKVPREIRENVYSELTKNGFFATKGVNIDHILNDGYSIYENAVKSVKQVNKELITLQQKMKLSKPFAKLRLHSSHEKPFVTINYNYTNPTEIEKILNQLLADYNDIIISLPEDYTQRNEEQRERVLRAIAKLFQNLEWLHPFYDGQGRTDLVLLAKLLTENGFNPTILYQPYFSSFKPLEKWIQYLKGGIEAWKVASAIPRSLAT